MKMRETLSRIRLALREWWPVIVPLVFYGLHLLAFGTWIIDDAGISYVYARNLVAGHGLVSQPGQVPVEAYSNFLWVLILALLFALKVFHPVITVKLVSFALIGLTFVWVYRALARFERGRTIAALSLALVALNTPFAIWTGSGLENPLTVALIGGLLVVAMRTVADGELRYRLSATAGLLAAALAMTRPDGIIYLVVYPSLLIVYALTSEQVGRAIRHVLAYGMAFALPYGGFLAFRLSYFGNILPNTYYAKVRPDVAGEPGALTLGADAVLKVRFLMSSMVWRAGLVVLGAVALGTGFLAGRKKLGWELGVLLAFLGCSLAVYALLPPDWMPFHRFGTAFFVMYYVYIVVLMDQIVHTARLPPLRRRRYLRAFAAVFVGFSAVMSIRQTAYFLRGPTVPFASVAERYGHRFNRYAAAFGLENGSVLLPDIGGTLYVSDLTVHDLAGLSDPTIAVTLGQDLDTFHAYIFETLQPDFVHTHAGYTRQADFDADSRFREDYVPLCEYVDPWLLEHLEVEMYSGDYVRRSVAETQPGILQQLQEQFAGDCR
jgi:hypothetical protein